MEAWASKLLGISSQSLLIRSWSYRLHILFICCSTLDNMFVFDNKFVFGSMFVLRGLWSIRAMFVLENMFVFGNVRVRACGQPEVRCPCPRPPSQDGAGRPITPGTGHQGIECRDPGPSVMGEPVKHNAP